MKEDRRTFLQTTLTGTTIGIAVSAGLLSPRAVLAAWPQSGFEAKSVTDALQAVLGLNGAEDSADIHVKAPDIAENGAVVPITVETGMKAENITVLVENNATPLIASFNLGDGADGYISTRIKMRKTSPVVAIVKSNGKLYSAKKDVKVTIGGCGG